MPLLPLATPAGRKEHHLVGHGDEENSNTTLIEKAPVHNVLRSELPPKELTENSLDHHLTSCVSARGKGTTGRRV
jgi:hypothetical protein